MTGSTSLAEQIALPTRWQGRQRVDDPVLAQAFGTVDPMLVGAEFGRWCRVHLGSSIARAWSWNVSVGCVAGVTLADGREVVVKAYPPDRSEAGLRAVLRVQRLAAAIGIAAPEPWTEPQPIGLGWATAETALLTGRRPDLLDSAQRAVAARGWSAITDHLPVAAVSDLIGPPIVRNRVVGGLYPVPHSPVFDFEATSAGAEWIDELARRARQIAAATEPRPIVAHMDWRSDNIRILDASDGVASSISAVYDWESVRIENETTAIGEVAAMHSIDWTTGPVFASGDQCVAFARDVEAARPTPFTAAAWRSIRASIVFGWCYTARCEHARASVGDDNPGFGMRARLRADGEQLLREAR